MPNSLGACRTMGRSWYFYWSGTEKRRERGSRREIDRLRVTAEARRGVQIEHDMVSATMIEEASQGMSCPVCGGVEIAEAFRVQQPYLNGERFSVLRCSVCGLGRTVPPVPSS